MIFFVLNISGQFVGVGPVAHLEVQFFFRMDVALFASDVDQLSQLLGELGKPSWEEKSDAFPREKVGKKQQKRGGFFFGFNDILWRCN